MPEEPTANPELQINPDWETATHEVEFIQMPEFTVEDRDAARTMIEAMNRQQEAIDAQNATPHAHLSAEEFERQFGGTQTQAAQITTGGLRRPAPPVNRVTPYRPLDPYRPIGNRTPTLHKRKPFAPKEPSEFVNVGASEIEKETPF